MYKHSFLGLAILICSFGATIGCSRSKFHDVQFDRTADGRTYFYAIDGSVWLRSAATGSPPLRLASGTSPCVAGASTAVYLTSGGRIWKWQEGRAALTAITSPSSDEIDYEPSFDPLVKRLYFARFTNATIDKRGTFDLYTCRADGSDVVRCTNQHYVALRLSPRSTHGRYLFFVGDLGTSNQALGQVVKMNTTPPYALSIQRPEADNIWQISVASRTGKMAIISGSGRRQVLSVVDEEWRKLSEVVLGNGIAENPIIDPAGDGVCHITHENDRVGIVRDDRQEGGNKWLLTISDPKTK